MVVAERMPLNEKSNESRATGSSPRGPDPIHDVGALPQLVVVAILRTSRLGQRGRPSGSSWSRRSSSRRARKGRGGVRSVRSKSSSFTDRARKREVGHLIQRLPVPVATEGRPTSIAHWSARSARSPRGRPPGHVLDHPAAAQRVSSWASTTSLWTENTRPARTAAHPRRRPATGGLRARGRRPAPRPTRPAGTGAGRSAAAIGQEAVLQAHEDHEQDRRQHQHERDRRFRTESQTAPAAAASAGSQPEPSR